VELYLHFANTPSFRGAQLQHRDNFTPLFIRSLIIHMLKFNTISYGVTVHWFLPIYLLNYPMVQDIP